MKKHTIYGLALAGAIAAAVPLLAYAQETHGVRSIRPQNAENNRDFRNAVLRKAQNGAPAEASTTAPHPTIMLRVEHRIDRANGEHPELPSWITASSSPFHGARISSTTMMELMRAAREATSTELRHEDRKNARLVEFAKIQSNLISQLGQSFDHLKDARNKIADRIQAAQQSGRDMTDAANLLSAADQKISAAEQAIQAISSLTPSISAQGTVNASTTVSLERPREIGKTAIQAVNEARKALNDVVVAIAHSMGLRIGEDGHVVPPIATSTPATTTQQ